MTLSEVLTKIDYNQLIQINLERTKVCKGIYIELAIEEYEDYLNLEVTYLSAEPQYIDSLINCCLYIECKKEHN